MLANRRSEGNSRPRRRVEVYARQAKDGTLVAHATEIKARATRRLGELMEVQRKDGLLKRGGSRVPRKPLPKTLAQQGIDKNLADRARKAAAQSEEEFEVQVATVKAVAVAAVEGDRSIVKAARARQQAEKKARRDEREVELGAKIMALPAKRFGVILADPPPSFEVWSSDTGMDRAAANHYPTESLAAIKALRVADIAASDCVLFLWATNPMLPQAIETMTAWGFAYVTNWVWVKTKAITGYWNRGKHELLLLGTRGKVVAPAQGEQWESVLVGANAKHSAKPEEVYLMIESYFPHVPKIELYARRRRPGWEAWGNEVWPSQTNDVRTETAGPVSAEVSPKGDRRDGVYPARALRAGGARHTIRRAAIAEFSAAIPPKRWRTKDQLDGLVRQTSPLRGAPRADPAFPRREPKRSTTKHPHCLD